MFKALKRMARGYESYMTFRGRVLAREHLLRYDDRMLADNGFSRELLEKGVTGWPWRTETKQDALLSGNTVLRAGVKIKSHLWSSMHLTPLRCLSVK